MEFIFLNDILFKPNIDYLRQFSRLLINLKGFIIEVFTYIFQNIGNSRLSPSFVGKLSFYFFIKFLAFKALKLKLQVYC